MHAAATDEGGRAHGMFSGYRPSFWWGEVSERGREYHDAQITFEMVETLAPGEEATAILQPLRPEYWHDVSVGSVLSVHEGARLVGTATVEQVIPEFDYDVERDRIVRLADRIEHKLDTWKQMAPGDISIQVHRNNFPRGMDPVLLVDADWPPRFAGIDMFIGGDVGLYWVNQDTDREEQRQHFQVTEEQDADEVFACFLAVLGIEQDA